VSTEKLFDFSHPVNDAGPRPARFQRAGESLYSLSPHAPSRCARRASLRTHPYRTTSPSHLFSGSCALFQKSVYLIENKGKLPVCKPFIFNRLRTLFHSSAGSPLFCISSPKHTGGIPPLKSQELKCLLSSRDCHQVTPYPSATCKACALVGAKPASARRETRRTHTERAKKERGGPGERAASSLCSRWNTSRPVGVGRESVCDLLNQTHPREKSCAEQSRRRIGRFVGGER